MNKKAFENWFSETQAGCYVADRERNFFERFAEIQKSGVLVQAGMGKWLVPSENLLCCGRDFYMRDGLWAWADESVDVLLMPHTLECSGMPHIALAEACRVLKPEGKAVLTGFNPCSLWGMGRWFDGVRLPEKKYCLPLDELKESVKTLGLDIIFGQFMVYAPPLNNRRALDLCRFMEDAGNRWWPHGAAVYGLVLQKHRAGVHVIPGYEHILEENYRVALGMARCNGVK